MFLPGDFAGQAVASQDYGFADLRAVAEQLQQREERIRTLTESLETCKRELKLMTRDRNSEHTRAEGFRKMVSLQSIWMHGEWGLHPEWTAKEAHRAMKQYVIRTVAAVTTHRLHLYLHEDQHRPRAARLPQSSSSSSSGDGSASRRASARVQMHAACVCVRVRVRVCG